MPEGHTIHRLAAHHHDLFAGCRISATSPQGRFAAGAAALSGALLSATEAYGKHLLHHFAEPGSAKHAAERLRRTNNFAEPGSTKHAAERLRRTSNFDADRTLHVHLGLYGRFSDGRVPAPPPVGQVRLRLSSDRHWLDLRGPAACELLLPAEVDALRERLGADPLRDDANPPAAYARIKRSPAPLAALLLDQSIVAGPGLAYVSEVLFRAGIPPTRPGRQLDAGTWWALWADLRELMRQGMEGGRIDTVYASHMPEAMGRPPRVDRHGGEVYVYRRAGQPCLICSTPIRRAHLAGRNSYWCPACQA